MERPSSKSSVRRQASAESLNRTEQTAQRQQSSDQQANVNLSEQAPLLRKSSRTSMAPLMARGDSVSSAGFSNAAVDSKSAAGGSKAAGDSKATAGGSTTTAVHFQSAAGGSKTAGGRSVRTAEDPIPRRSERITPAVVQEVSGKLGGLKISKKPEGAQQIPRAATLQRKPGVAGPSLTAGISTSGRTSLAAAAERSIKPAEEVNARKLVMCAMEELKSRKGVSLAAIDQNIRSKLGDEAKHWRPYVRTYLRKALKTGKLVHVPSRKRKDVKVAKGLQGHFKTAVLPKKPAHQKSAKAKKLPVKVKKTQVKSKKLAGKPERRQKQRPTQRTC